MRREATPAGIRRRSNATRRVITAGAALSSVALALSLPTADARPQYAKSFTERYPGLRPVFMQAKCWTCHCRNDRGGKAAFNDYGAAVRDGLGGRNLKEPAQIRAALLRAETQPTLDPRRTFGDLIAMGRLPGTPCIAVPPPRSPVEAPRPKAAM